MLWTRILFAVPLALALAAPATSAQFTYVGVDDPRGPGGPFPISQAARADFVATLVTAGTDDLESYPNFTPAPTLTFAPLNVTSTTTSAFAATFPPLATSGMNVLNENGPLTDTPPIPSYPDVFTISQPVTAFGLYISQAGDGLANTITMVLENTILNTSKTVLVADLPGGAEFYNVFFFGVTDTDPFNKVSIVESYDYDGTVYDDITIGYVPEPGSLVLLSGVAGLALLAGRVRRRVQK